MKIEAEDSSDTLVNTYRTTWHHNQGVHNLNSQIYFNVSQIVCSLGSISNIVAHLMHAAYPFNPILDLSL
jgi:hypothetical protein